MAQNDQVKQADLIIINFLKIKNTEKVFIIYAQNWAVIGVNIYIKYKKVLDLLDFEKNILCRDYTEI